MNLLNSERSFSRVAQLKRLNNFRPKLPSTVDEANQLVNEAQKLHRLGDKAKGFLRFAQHAQANLNKELSK